MILHGNMEYPSMMCSIYATYLKHREPLVKDANILTRKTPTLASAANVHTQTSTNQITTGKDFDMSNYKEEKDMNDKVKANHLIIVEMPAFCKEFFDARRDLAGSSRMAYCYTLLDFFNYLHDNNSYYGAKEVTEITLADLNLLKKKDFEEYITWKETHVKNKQTGASAASLKRTKAILSTFWTYFVQENELDTNPLVGIRLAKLEAKDPIALNSQEQKHLLETVKYGIGLTGAANRNHINCKERDFAIVYLFLRTGIRISELVGIDVRDIDFYEHKVAIQRKGRKSQEVYFSDEAELALRDYLDVRTSKYKPYTTDALFLNKYGERITERSVERMLEKYVKLAFPTKKNISPHKLRSTYATDMLKKTENIELVSKQLGHSKISTTQIYASSDRDQRSRVRNIIDTAK